MPIAERPLRGSTQVRAEVDSMSRRFSPGGPDAHMASCRLQVVAGRVRLAGALSQAGMAPADARELAGTISISRTGRFRGCGRPPTNRRPD
jgi:hypothetical protein